MKNSKIKLIAFGADLLCCILLGAAVCAAWLPYLRLEADFGGYLLLMAADLALIIIFSRRWWVFPAFFAFAMVLFMLVVTVFPAGKELLQSAAGFVCWTLAGYPNALPFSQDGSITILRLVMALPVAALSYLYYRKLFAFAALPPVALALLLHLHSTGSAHLMPVLILLLSVLLISMAKMTGSRINKRLPESDRISSVLLQVFAILLVPFILLFAFAFSPEKDGDWRSKGLVYLVEDFSDAWDARQKATAMMRTFDIGKSGFSPLGNRLGGDIVLDHNIVMKVKTSRPLRLAGAVFDTYDGSAWQDAGDLGGYRLTSPLWQKMRREVFNLDKPNGERSARELYAKLTSPVALDITYDVHGNTLFYAGQVQSLKRTNFDLLQLHFNRQAELTTKSVQFSLHYTLNTTVFNRGAKGFDEDLLTLETLAASTPDKGLDDNKAYYLQLPKTLPGSVNALAQEITAGCASPYEKAVAIESWLSKNCSYTLTPGEPPKGRDFVDYFLQTRKGYCVYYASAMTVLARCASLPARYVTGYALKQNPKLPSPVSFVATNATAHAWTEIYFKGIGWLPFDATGWNFYEPTAVVDQQLEDMRPQATKKPFADVDNTATEGQGTQSKEYSTTMPTGVKVTFAAILFLVVALGVFASLRFAILWTDAQGCYKRLCRRYAKSGDRLDAAYRRVVRQVDFFGLKPNVDDTLASFASRVDRQLGTKELSAAFAPVMRMRFALVEPTEADVLKVCALSAALERRLRADLGKSTYLWRRILLGR